MLKKYYIWVLGCQMNKSDGQRAKRILEKIGYKKAKNQNDADLILVLACSVRQSAIDRIFGKAKALKKGNATKILSGCVLKDDRKKMSKIFDYFIETKDLVKLSQILKKENKIFRDFFSIKPLYSSNFSAYVPIMTGCDNFCTYCVVPLTKGREKSRSFPGILREIRELVKNDYKEIILLGQNVNSFGSDLKSKKYNFANLLAEVNKIKGDFWIRFITSNPHDMSDEIISAIVSSKKVTEYVHLPIQSGNNEILRKMNRKYTREDYFKLIEKLRKKIPNMSLSTDTIVGFPGETIKQFRDTVDVYRRVKYDMAYIAKYSPRKGTVAYKMKDNVSFGEKKRREKELTKILEKTAQEFNKKLEGKILDVLFDKHEKGFLYGRTRNFKLVKARGSKKLLGNFAKVYIKKSGPWSLAGLIKNPSK